MIRECEQVDVGVRCPGSVGTSEGIRWTGGESQVRKVPEKCMVSPGEVRSGCTEAV